MKTDMQLPDFGLPAKIKLFCNTASSVAFLVLCIHFVVLAIYAFTLYDWTIILKGFAFSEWSVLGRCLILIPYLFLPVLLAVLKVAGAGLPNAFFRKFKRGESSDTEES